MAANKFATMLHRNTNKITLILIYAILEWILIVLLLLNSLFSYLIFKFADYFGLKRPCLWCARLDHIFEPQKGNISYRDLVCETHASEISKLGHCPNHQKLAESEYFCEDCSSSSRSDRCELSKNLSCSCCGMSLESKISSPYSLINPSLGVLDFTQNGNFIEKSGVDDEIDRGNYSNQIGSEFVEDRFQGEVGNGENREIDMGFEVDGGFRKIKEEEKEDWSCFVSHLGSEDMLVNEYDKVDDVQESVDEAMIQDGCKKDSEIPPLHLEFFLGRDDYELIPVEEEGNCDNGDVVFDFEACAETQFGRVVEKVCISGETMALLSDYESKEESKIEVFESLKLEENGSTKVLHTEEDEQVVIESLKLEENESTTVLHAEKDEQVVIAQATDIPVNGGYSVQATSEEAGGEMDSDVHLAPEEVSEMQSDEIEADISIGTDIPEQEQIVEIQDQDLLPSYQCTQEDPSTSYPGCHADDDHGSRQAEEQILKFQTISVEKSERAISNHSSSCLEEVNEIEEDKVPDTPTSIDSLHQFHRKLLLLERKESGTEKSLDGSVFSDIEFGDGVLTIEKLKSVLKSERKALNALYAELEEERSASAVAANQTMAMINRLQEEKAAMQMEGLQYQRMMDEQSEYDQEALQHLNELVVKREKEKQELQKELEMYRKKLQEYEAKEKSRISSASCSNGEGSDGASVDLNCEEDSNLNTPADAVLYLEESLANFEVERVSILEQLKVLEEKLFTRSDDDNEEQNFEDVKPIKHVYEENGNGYHDNFNFSCENGNGVENGHHNKMKGYKTKRLLPLFDATDGETEDGVSYGNGHGYNSAATNFGLENKKIIEEEADHVHGRLQALEADWEFLKHCIGSLRKGDKGIYLLQEILQHLRELRSVELRVRNMSDGPL